jgi:hypothetical protein
MRLTLLLGLFVLSACSSSEGTGTNEPEAVSDIFSMTRRPDGLFDVHCRDGRFEVASAEQILANAVCNAGGGPVGAALRVQYACDSSSRLEIRTLRFDGTEAVERIPFSFTSSCQSTASKLTAARAQIARPTFFAVCDDGSTLQRFAVSASGGLNRISPTPYSFSSSCTREMDRTNGPIASVFGEVARVDYTCSDNNALEVRVIGGAATESKTVIPYSFASTCTSTAETMRRARTDIATVSAMGICDDQNTLRRFSITPSGKLTDLGSTPLSFASECRRAMDEANR